MRTVRRLAGLLRGAPLTVGWAGVLLVTTSIQKAVPPDRLDDLLHDRSTNLANLTTHPLRSIVVSLFWIDGQYWLPYLLLYLLFHRPAERWLGSRRWLAVGLIGHTVATYLSQGLVAVAIHRGVAEPSMVDVRDVGVSYFLAAIVAVLTYYIARPWRWLYLAGVLADYAIPLVRHPSFTAAGHATAVLIGLACYPLVRQLAGAPWDPATLLHRPGSSPRAN